MSLLTKTLIGALIPFLLIVAYVASTQHTTPREAAFVDIGVEHKVKGELTMMVTRNDLLRMIDITNSNNERIDLSVPEDWKRGEVRGAKLSDVTSDAPSFSYVRWHIPAHATVNFSTDHPFAHIKLHNPSGVLMQITFTQVDLVTDGGMHDVYLVKDGSVLLP